jgi:ubiquinone biosynthesis protein
MVMEWMTGVPVSHIETLRSMNVDFKRLARDGVEVFFTQVFRDGFFHADMHPGNVFIGTTGAQCGHYIALDCGIVGALSETDRYYLAINFLAFFNRDYQGVAQAHIESGWVPADTPLEALTSTVRTVCEPYFGRPISEISLGQVLMRLFDVSREFNVSVQPQLVLLQKTLLNVEGMGRVLDPDLDLWQTAKPFLERWMRDTLGIKGVMRQIKRELPFIARHLPQMPRGILKYVQNSAHSDEYLSRIQELEARLARQEQRFRWSCVYGFGMLLLFIFLLKIVFDWMV